MSIFNMIASGGSSGSSGWTAAGIAAGTEPSGDITIGTKLVGYAFYGNTAITNVYAPTLTSVTGNYHFNGCTNLQKFVAPNLTSVPASALRSSPVRYIIAPNCSVGSSSNAFRQTSAIIADLYALGSAGYVFSNCSAITTLILRSTTTSSVASTSLNLSASHTITVYVPSALISEYQSATNWSTWYSSGYCTFVALEGSTYESTDWWESL